MTEEADDHRRTAGRRRRLSPDARRESILEVAEEVFAASGYRNGRISVIAERVGVTEPVVFQNFGSKAALFAAVLERVSARITDEAHGPQSAQPATAPERLAHVLAPAGPGAGGSPPVHRVLFADAASLTSDPAFAETARTALRAVADHLADIVRQGQRDGSLRADVDADAAGWLLLSALAARPTLVAATGDDTVARAVASLAIEGLLRKPPGRLPPLAGSGGGGDDGVAVEFDQPL